MYFIYVTLNIARCIIEEYAMITNKIAIVERRGIRWQKLEGSQEDHKRQRVSLS